MNLAKLFNGKYLVQNLKKSRVTLAFVLLILPILNLLIFCMQTSTNKISVLALNDISGLTTFGMYIIPIILSLILFSYVFKRKSIDFIGSMPIDRKTIFTTNTVGGILIITALIGITTLLMIGASAILPNIYIPMGIFLDYFVLFTLSYIFVFVVCNIGLSLAGNVATTLVITALILFLAPFLHFVYQNSHYYYEEVYYECDQCAISDTGAESGKYQTGLTREYQTSHYTTPAEAIIETLRNDTTSLYNDVALGRMALLIILYILVGFVLFQRKELEICEISFKNIKVHMLVKSLTMIPMLVFIYEITRDADFIGFLFTLAILLIYSFVYDLITKKSISHVRLNLLFFLGTLVILYPFSGWLLGDYENGSPRRVTLTEDNIEKVEVDLSFLDRPEETIKITDKTVYNLLLQPEEVTEEEAVTKNYYSIYIEVHANNSIYDTYISIDEDRMKQLKEMIMKSDAYQNLSKASLENIDVATLSEDYAKLTDQDIALLKSAIDQPDQEKSTFYLPITAYTYQNHELTEETYYSNLTDTLNQTMVERYNEVWNKYRKEHSDARCNWMDIIDEYTYETNTYAINEKCKEILSILEKQTTNSKEKLYRITAHFENNVYLNYYTNLDAEALKTLNMANSETDEIVEEEVVTPDVD